MFCVREEPVVFLHKEDDYVPYTPRRKENLHENLHDLEKDVMVEGLELTIRKEVTKTHSGYIHNTKLLFQNKHSFSTL